jgi:uncharacterized caspase-like protein/tetratricopeptide (TPR) repeat protein
MPKHIALVIGISNYKFLPKLIYAQKDAELIGEFLAEAAGFNTKQGGEVCLCTQDSPEYHSYSTRPTRAELRRILRRCFDRKFLSSEDSFWFFFSGHGIRYADKDYLMPVDGDPEEPDETAIELNYVTERLTRSGAGQIVVVLDACRSEGQKSSHLAFGQDVAKGITTIFSCSPREPSYEIGDPIYQGAFTYVFLQSLQQQTSKNALTVSELSEYLQKEVPKLTRKYKRISQTPNIVCDAASGSKILLPHLRVQMTVDHLKNSAFRAEAFRDWKEAHRLWLTVLRRTPTGTTDHTEALEGLERVGDLVDQVMSSSQEEIIDKSEVENGTETREALQEIPEENIGSTDLPLTADVIEKKLEEAKFLHSQRDLPKALSILDSVLEIEPSFIEAYYERALVKKQMRNFLGAIQDLTKGIENDPENHFMYYQRGLIRAGNQESKADTEAAISDFSKVIENDIRYGEAYYLRGAMNYRLRRFQATLSDCDQSLLLASEDDEYQAKAYYGKGLAYTRLGHDQEAVDSFSRAIAINNREPSFYQERAKAYANLGNKRQAAKDRQSADKFDGSQPLESPWPW